MATIPTAAEVELPVKESRMFDPAPLTIFILAALALLLMPGPAVLYIKYPTYLATGTV